MPRKKPTVPPADTPAPISREAWLAERRQIMREHLANMPAPTPEAAAKLNAHRCRLYALFSELYPDEACRASRCAPDDQLDYPTRWKRFFQVCDHKYRAAFGCPPPGCGIEDWHRLAASLGLPFNDEMAPDYIARCLAPCLAGKAKLNVPNFETSPADRERKAESKTESNGNSSPFPLPENPDVSRLAKYITREWKKRPYETKTSLANEFAKGDEARAQNLLRQLRSFPQLLERAENERKGRLK